MNLNRDLLNHAARAIGQTVDWRIAVLRSAPDAPHLNGVRWNPLTDSGDRYRLAAKLKMAVDFEDCTAYKRLPNGDLIQEFWGGDCPSEATAIVLVAAKLGGYKP